LRAFSPCTHPFVVFAGPNTLRNHACHHPCHPPPLPGTIVP
jgi:hypothetical protein